MLPCYSFLLAFINVVSCLESEFSLKGDYLLGGLFPIHEGKPATHLFTPEAIECFRYTFSKSGYQMLQVMRFAVEEINNSTTLLPDVSLGYEIFDHCSDTKNFPSVLSFISKNGSIKPKLKLNNYEPEVIALTGPYGSTTTITIAPLITMDLIPLVNYGASSYSLSNKLMYPSFVRTVPSNKDLIHMIIQIIQWFGWNWVAFLGDQDDYSEDGLRLFNTFISNSGICLAYQEALSQKTNYSLTFEMIDMLNVNVIVVFAEQQYASNIIKAAIANDVRDKVWIASETWSMNQQLPREPGIEKIGTVIGITERFLSLPGFNEFIYKERRSVDDAGHNHGMGEVKSQTCNQDCDCCTLLTAEEIITENPTFTFGIYSAIYTIAHALHKVLQCDVNVCDKNTTAKPYMLLEQIKKLDFPLNDRQVKYDANGDPTISFAIILWHTETDPPHFDKVGMFDTYPEVTFTINNTLLPWHNNVPFSNCSAECKEGFAREHDRFHTCCFLCKKCPRNSYVDYTRDPYTCFPCAESEWSDEGSTACKNRSVAYLQLTEASSITVLFSATCLMTVLIAIFVLFACNYNTPVVRSAGGSMCFLMLACLIMSTVSVFFFFGEPTFEHCILRNVIFAYFFSVFLSCMAVRSFQIVCIFKMAAKFPSMHSLWVKHNGQWLFVGFFSIINIVSCVLYMTVSPPKPFRDLVTFKDQLILSCEIGNTVTISMVMFIAWFLGFLCLVFSYMGRDLPKNYNEAKSITFSLILYYLSWIVYFTTYLMLKSKYIQLVNAMTELSSIYGILFSYFIPKSYIIIFQPHKNTPAYFQTSIQSYTQTISRT
ncbi:taste receptor type 1 member 2.2 precursor [Danio rerio]|uniref:Taste receptor type 1 member 2.2 precursor n=1 Tax=Danio rerio TaxID=7955 RepID=A4PHQ8_DANRE|nr:taste receptor type 1 member 2.2 precursor [Danio rerio]BAF49681.1 taste receptor type 1 member 2b [Danio rerio]|eukprot:NP_001077325.1 taste receptor, type 1, member 2, tandem duplicate 2 precursor [Danio rerio]